MFSANEPNRGRGAISPETMDDSKDKQNKKNPNDQDRRDKNWKK
ncbi:MAG: hypothetical protein K0S60_680 [Evtepia sp.]|nr:hypothetical protein [Evtepia sp.]